MALRRALLGEPKNAVLPWWKWGTGWGQSRLRLPPEFYPFFDIAAPKSTKVNCLPQQPLGLSVSISMFPPRTAEGKIRCHGQPSRAAQPAKAKATGTAKGTPATPGSPCHQEPLSPGVGGSISLPRDDSDAEEDWLTPKVTSESLSSWEPLKDPDGVVVSGLDCRVPGSQRDATGFGTSPASPHRSAPLLSREWTGVTVRVLTMWRHLCFACPASIPPRGH